MRLLPGAWARETGERELPMSRDLAGTNMMLDEGAIRDMHWHNHAEWSFIHAGRVQVSGIDLGGTFFEDDVEEGDLCFFPVGVPHSLQGLQGGAEFLLVSIMFFSQIHPHEDTDFLRRQDI